MSLSKQATDLYGLGRQAGMGEPEDLSGCSCTVFGVKILCGLMATINPQPSQEDRGFFFADRGSTERSKNWGRKMAYLRTALMRGFLVAVILAGVSSQVLCFPIKAKDDRGKEFEFTEPPRRIVSLVPTQTELLFSLGLE
jgi:hypothetical protein